MHLTVENTLIETLVQMILRLIQFLYVQQFHILTQKEILSMLILDRSQDLTSQMKH